MKHKVVVILSTVGLATFMAASAYAETYREGKCCGPGGKNCEVCCIGNSSGHSQSGPCPKTLPRPGLPPGPSPAPPSQSVATGLSGELERLLPASAAGQQSGTCGNRKILAREEHE